MTCIPSAQIFKALTHLVIYLRRYDYTSKHCEAVVSRASNAAALCVVWAPTTSDSTARTLWAGYADGVVRTFGFSPGEKGTSQAGTCLLIQTMKPHTTPVRSIQVSPSGGQVLAVTDNAVFFFQNENGNLEPEGFYELEGDKSISSVRYANSGDRILVGCSRATLLEIGVPARGVNNVSRTFRFDELHVKSYTVVSQLDKINAAKIEAAKPKKPKKSKADAESDATDADKNKTDKTTGEEEGEEGEEAAVKVVVHPPCNITDAWYTTRGTFIVTFDGRDAEYAYECSFDMEEPTMYFAMPNQSTATVRRSQRVCKDEWLALPANDGTVRFHDARDFNQSSMCVVALCCAARFTDLFSQPCLSVHNSPGLYWSTWRAVHSFDVWGGFTGTRCITRIAVAPRQSLKALTDLTSSPQVPMVTSFSCRLQSLAAHDRFSRQRQFFRRTIVTLSTWTTLCLLTTTRSRKKNKRPRLIAWP